MALLSESILEPVFRSLHGRSDPRVFIALSGGMDSVTLLHLLAQARQSNTFSLTALHVDHGLQAGSEQWATDCEKICAAMDVSFLSVRLNLSDSSEAGARSARYDWFRSHVRYGDVLLTAHHQQDRAETVLFNLMRGSGSAGLSSLRYERPFFGARLLRPLLHSTKQEIREYAEQNKLQWVEDPSNQNTDFARNHIRQNVLPALHNYRADAVRNIARAASNLEQEHSLLREIAIADLTEVRELPRHALDNSHSISTVDIGPLSPARQANLLRFWLGSLNLHLPSKGLMEKLLHSIANPPASTAVLQEDGCQFRFYRGYLYVMPAVVEAPEFQPMEWQNPEQPLALFQQQLRVDATQKLRQFYRSCSQGSLRLQSRQALQNPQALQGHSLNLKKWLQDSGVPPWRRQNLPILTLRQSQRDVVLAPVDQHVQTEWLELQQSVA